MAAKHLAMVFNIMSLSDSKPGCVYLVLEVNDPNGPHNYKVGQSGGPDTRLSTLQTGNPRKLEFVSSCKIQVSDMSAAEKAAKVALLPYKCNLGGGIEWYTAQPGQDAALKMTFENAVAPYKI